MPPDVCAARERERDDGDADDADACLSVVAPVGILVWDFPDFPTTASIKEDGSA